MTYPIITRHIKLFFLISALFLIPGIFSLVRWGLRPSIDFTGGTLLEVSFVSKSAKDINRKQVTEVLGSNAKLENLQITGEKNLTLRLNTIDLNKKNEIIKAMHEKIDPNVKELRFETIGPTLGKELLVKTAIGLVLAIVLIVIYLGMRFPSWQYGVSAALAAVHDMLIILGTFSLLGHFAGVEVDVLFVTALLTVLSFSLHDTLITYDRIREKIKKKVNLPFEEIVNLAVLETINRSLRNSLAVILMLLIVFLIGGATLKWFVFALLIGTITGTYSSTCVALPILILWERLKNKAKKS